MSSRSAKEIWDAALGELQIQVSKPNYDTWLKDTVGLDYSDGFFTVGVSRPFAAEWLEKRLNSLIKRTLAVITGNHSIEIRFHISTVQEAYQSPRPAQVSDKASFDAPASRPSQSCSQLNPKYTFGNFITGGCNQLAYAAGMAIAEKPGTVYNPLFIHSKVGLGKTHILQAIGHAACSNGYEVLSASTEQFINEFVDAIKGKEVDKFRKKYRSPDILLLDDVHFISGKEQTQEGFFHTFNDLYNANKQIVVTCDRPPKAVPMLEDRISSRFQGGLIVDIQPPDYETCMSLLRAKAKQQKVALSEEVIHIIAVQSCQNMRELEGAFNRVVAYVNLSGNALTPDAVEQVLQDSEDSQEIKVTPDLILEIVSAYFNIAIKELIGRKRAPQICEARQVAMYMMREEAKCPLSEIGNVLGGRDHSTVLQGCKKILSETNKSQQMRTHLEGIKSILSENYRSC